MMKMDIVLLSLTILCTTSILLPTSGRADEDAKIWENGYFEYSMRMNISEAPLSFKNVQDGEEMGEELAGEGDFNGDGIDDLLIASPFADLNGITSGRIELYLGGREIYGHERFMNDSDITFVPIATQDCAGWDVAFAGDINGDGFDDILISDGHNHGGGSYGSVNVILGRGAGWLRNWSLQDSDLRIVSTDYDFHRPFVSGAGDVNGDGLDDILVSVDNMDSDGKTWAGKAFLFFGKRSGWKGTRPLESSEASFIGVSSTDYLGSAISGCGDMDKDGFDDFIIGARGANNVVGDVGKTYLFYGKASGWLKNCSAATADTVLVGEGEFSFSGYTLSGGKDLNGDGLNDVLIGAPYYHYSGMSSYPEGKVYVVLGRPGRLPSSIDLSQAEGSFIGETTGDYMGNSLDMVGDIDGDGCSDIIIGASMNNYKDNYAGQAYLVKGRRAGWEQNANISSASTASFIGENAYDYAGNEVVGIGDFDGNGGPEFAVSAPYNDYSGSNSGIVYVFPGMNSYPPVEVYFVDTFKDELCTEPIKVADRGETVYFKLVGLDGNSSSKNCAYLNLTLNMTMTMPLRIGLRETGKNTGVYTGKFIVPFNARYKEELKVCSTDDLTKTASILVDTPIRLTEHPDKLVIEEEQGLSLKFENLGYSTTEQWSFETDGAWIKFDKTTHRITGIPRNAQVGTWKIKVTLTDDGTHNDSKEISLTVKNVPPVILTTDVPLAIEDEFYCVDYGSDEDDEGNMTWSLSTNASWLEILPDQGVLRGTPQNADVGWYWVHIWVDDCNGGKTLRYFNVTVGNTNDPPEIISEDTTTVDQGLKYRKSYEAVDIDAGDVLVWSLTTDAAWLKMEGNVLSGIPGPMDVGFTHVEVKVTDRAGGSDAHTFELEVVNVNDGPVWSDVPEDSSVFNGELYSFDVNATDLDTGADLRYSITSKPYTDISIDQATGMISWVATIKCFEREPYILNAEVTVSDGIVSIKHPFKICVKLSTPPVSEVIAPAEGEKVRSHGSFLEWEGLDADGDPLTYDLYIGENKAYVSALKEEVLYYPDYDGTSIEITGLSSGGTYYWTVIPFDGCSPGTCRSPVRSFRLNSPPMLEQQEMKVAPSGSAFRLFLLAEDPDIEDRANLRFSLKEFPSGMTLDNDTGVIDWVPSREQVMLHKIVATVSDGLETTEMSFTIEVAPSSEGSDQGALMIGIGAGIVIATIAVVLLIMMIRKRSAENTRIEGGNKDDQGPAPVEMNGAKHNFCSVSIDINEAHAADQADRAPKTYEELYGIKMPEEREDSTDEMNMTGGPEEVDEEEESWE